MYNFVCTKRNDVGKVFIEIKTYVKSFNDAKDE